MSGASDSKRSLECSGFTLGCLYVPAFDLGPGEIAKLVVPKEHAVEIDRMINAFCAEQGEHVRADGRVVALAMPMTRSALREFFHRQTAAEWLIARCGMTQEEAAPRLNEVGVNPAAPISTLAGNPRWLIGFLAATWRHTSAVVFTTAGCDASGIRQALATANARLGSACGVYLTCFPDVGVPEPDYAGVLDVVVREPEPVA
ncbi:MAG TPA: hypothetical protein VML55_00880 [Planctomycetaceae bacterium]|nr:hypothetical protein [Planctomycetaceae bacterium]